MENPDVIRRLEKLPPQKKEILKCFCRGMSTSQIAEKFCIQEGTVRSHMTQIYIKLELDLISVDARRAVLLRLYCEAFEKYVRGSEYEGEKVLVDLSPESFEKEVEDEEEKMSKKDKERSEEASEMIDSDHKEIIKLDSRKWEKIDDSGLVAQKEEFRRKPTPFQVGLFIFALIGFAVVAIFLYGFLTGNFQFIRAGQEQIEQQQPTQSRAQIQEEPTQIMQPTAIPTNAETSTPEPTAPPQPAILFEDNFENGLSNAWEVVSGNPMIVNGKLTTDQDTWLLVGDPSWKNISVEFNTNFKRSTFGTGTSFNGIGLRAKDVDNMYFIRWGEYQDGIFIIEDGNWNELPDTGYDVIDKEVNLRITVVDGQVTLYDNGVKALSFFDTRFENGRVAVHIFANSTFDDFKIKEILE